MRFLAMRIVIQARDGRWHFGPEEREAEMLSSSHGVFRTAADASQAATYREPQACSLSNSPIPNIRRRS